MQRIDVESVSYAPAADTPGAPDRGGRAGRRGRAARGIGLLLTALAIFAGPAGLVGASGLDAAAREQVSGVEVDAPGFSVSLTQLTGDGRSSQDYQLTYSVSATFSTPGGFAWGLAVYRDTGCSPGARIAFDYGGESTLHPELAGTDHSGQLNATISDYPPGHYSFRGYLLHLPSEQLVLSAECKESGFPIPDRSFTGIFAGSDPARLPITTWTPHWSTWVLPVLGDTALFEISVGHSTLNPAQVHIKLPCGEDWATLYQGEVRRWACFGKVGPTPTVYRASYDLTMPGYLPVHKDLALTAIGNAPTMPLVDLLQGDGAGASRLRSFDGWFQSSDGRLVLDAWVTNQNTQPVWAHVELGCPNAWDDARLAPGESRHWACVMDAPAHWTNLRSSVELRAGGPTGGPIGRYTRWFWSQGPPLAEPRVDATVYELGVPASRVHQGGWLIAPSGKVVYDTWVANPSWAAVDVDVILPCATVHLRVPVGASQHASCVASTGVTWQDVYSRLVAYEPPLTGGPPWLERKDWFHVSSRP